MTLAGDALSRSWLPPALAGFTGAGVRVAVIDSGVNCANPHVGKVEEAVSLFMQSDGRVELAEDTPDRIGHGTACAAVIRGWAPRCMLLSAKVFHERLAAPTEVLIAALEWTSSRGAQVVNLSLGTYREDRIPRLEAACRKASRAGAVIVAPIADAQKPPAPARFPFVVTALPDLESKEFSLRRGSRDGVDFIVHPYPRRIPGIDVQNNFRGSSFASAHVSGLLCLVREGWPAAGEARVKEILWALIEEPAVGQRLDAGLERQPEA